MRRLVVVSGLSGSGKTAAIRAIEDCGFFCVDNLPPPLLEALLRLVERLPADSPGVAVVMDAREGTFLEDIPPALERARAAGLEPEILFLVASDEVVVRRFHETRRRHPLDRGSGTADAVARERELLSEVAAQADQVLDTTFWNVHDLRRAVRALYEGEQQISVRLVSFGFKHGVPGDANLVVDVRFLPNPHFVADLRPRDGTDAEVAAFALSGDAAHDFLVHYQELLAFLLPLYEVEGKLTISIAVGCTGGRHRSVAVVEWLAAWLRAEGYPVVRQHRDIDKGG